MKNLLSKSLAVGIIVVLFGVSFISSAGSVNVYENDKEIKSYDNNIEIISFIRGDGRGYTSHNDKLLVRDIGIGGGIIEVTAITSIEPFDYYKTTVHDIRIPHFIGICMNIHQDYCVISGIAIGNIDING